jgi:hypothetical protein
MFQKFFGPRKTVVREEFRIESYEKDMHGLFNKLLLKMKLHTS